MDKLRGRSGETARKAAREGIRHHAQPPRCETKLGDLLGPINRPRELGADRQVHGRHQARANARRTSATSPARRSASPSVYQGVDAVRKIREVLGPTDPSKAPPGTIRREFGSTIMVNAAHASDSPENAAARNGHRQDHGKQSEAPDRKLVLASKRPLASIPIPEHPHYQNPTCPWNSPIAPRSSPPRSPSRIDSKAKAMKAEGIDVCGFGAGEPDFDTPEHIKAAASAALEAGFTKYTPRSGIPGTAPGHRRQVPGRQQARLQAARRSSSATAPSTPATTPSSPRCQPGDEVIIPAPYWLSYPEMVAPRRRRAGLRPDQGRERLEDDRRGVPGRDDAAHEDGHHQLARQPDRLRLHARRDRRHRRCRRRTRRSSSSPTRSTRSSSMMAPSTSASRRSRPRRYDLTITVNGFSKAYAMTGWRLGYLGAPEADRQGHRRHPEPQHLEPVLLRAEGRPRRAQGRPAAGGRHARRIRHAPQLHGEPPRRRSRASAWSSRRALSTCCVNIGQLGLNSTELRRPPAQQASRRRRPRHRLRRRPHRAPLATPPAWTSSRRASTGSRSSAARSKRRRTAERGGSPPTRRGSPRRQSSLTF